MKYELETIPVWDAYDGDHECPLCVLEKKAGDGYIDFYLGSSVMNPETRVEVNKKGFCPAHFARLFDSRKNRHGLGLISHTHLKERMKESAGIEKRLLSKARGEKEEPIKKLAAQYIEHLSAKTGECMICDRIDYTLKRYTFTIIYLWKRDDQDFRQKYSASRGFCTAHLIRAMKMAEETLSGAQYTEWVQKTIQMQKNNMERLEAEIFWYTQKFDFQNNDKPWGTSKDALHRTIQKLTGIIQPVE